VNERAGNGRSPAGELVDDGDRGDDVAPAPAVRFVDRETADAELGEPVEDRAIEGAVLVPLPELLARHLGGREFPKRVAELRDMRWLVGEVHAVSPSACSGCRSWWAAT
jgi:hypothetical protein